MYQPKLTAEQLQDPATLRKAILELIPLTNDRQLLHLYYLVRSLVFK
jgi:hypothetical protein